MLDRKEIEEAALNETFGMYGESESIENGFVCGAKWVINKFLNNLWHSSKEKPNREGKPILFSCIDHNMLPSWCVYPIGFQGNWSIFCDSHGISKWLYIDDLFPNKGDDNELL